MKSLLRYLGVILLAAMCSVNAYAQPTFAPDFTVTDLDGVEHNLYTYLDQGKTVVVDFSATWCPPCWDFHQTYAMDDAFNTYGPAGSDEIVVITLEVDNTTGMDDLMGNTAGTMGDWLTGHDAPLADNADDVGTAYGVTGIPTILAICPNRSITDLYTGSFPTANTMYNAHNNCPVATAAIDAALLEHDITEVALCGDVTFSPTMSIQNNGLDAMTSAIFRLEDNSGIIQDLSWTGNVSTYSLIDVTFDPVTVTQATTLTMSVIQVNGASDPVVANNQLTHTISDATAAETNTVEISVLTDDYGCETYWEFRDLSNGTVMASGGNPNTVAGGQTQSYPCDETLGYANNTTYTQSVTIPADGCYEFYLLDDYGDGICCGFGQGSYSVTDQDGNVLFSGGQFLAEDSGIADVTTIVDVEDLVSSESFRVFPNPAQDFVSVEFSLVEATEMTVALYDALGQQVKTVATANYVAGANNLTINTADLATGVYVLTLQTDEGNISRRITVSK